MMLKITIQTPLKKALEASVTGLDGTRPALNQFARLGLGAVLAVALTLLGLSGCGPGTGGTGVGPVTSSTFVSTVYSGNTITNASSAITTSVTAPLPGLVTTDTGCTIQCAANIVILRLEADGVQLQSGCSGFTSHAPLPPAAISLVGVSGTYQKRTTLSGQTMTSSAPANLFLEFANGQSDSTAVYLSVRDAAGIVLLGPVTLQRVDTASAAVAIDANPASFCP